MKQLTDSQNWRPQYQKGTWPRRGGGRCWREGETGTKRRRRRRGGGGGGGGQLMLCQQGKGGEREREGEAV